MQEGKPMVESEPFSKEISHNPQKAIEYLKKGAILQMYFEHGNRFIYMMGANKREAQLFPTNIFNSLRDLQIIKEADIDVFIYNNNQII